MTITKTHELPNFRRMMREVQLHQMTPEGAAAAIDEHIRVEVARRVSNGLDVELALHPIGTIQEYADRLSRDQDRVADRMVSVLLREYVLLRRRMADERLRAMTETAPPPKPMVPKQPMNAEQQLFEVLRDMGKVQLPDRRKNERRNDK